MLEICSFNPESHALPMLRGSVTCVPAGNPGQVAGGWHVCVTIGSIRFL